MTSTSTALEHTEPPYWIPNFERDDQVLADYERINGAYIASAIRDARTAIAAKFSARQLQARQALDAAIAERTRLVDEWETCRMAYGCALPHRARSLHGVLEPSL